MWRKDTWLTKDQLTPPPRLCNFFQSNVAFNHPLSLWFSGIFTTEADEILSSFREKTFDKLTVC